MRPFRFGLQLDPASNRFVENAQRAEAAGFDIVHTSDHIGPLLSGPLVPLAAIAEATSRIGIGSLVVNNDFQNPALLARDALMLHRMSGGRLELGIGAGHSFTEYEAMGLRFDRAATRKARLREAVEILGRVFDGGPVTYQGSHYQLADLDLGPGEPDRPRILVGVNGGTALDHAVHHADVVGLTMLGRTLPDGQRHETHWDAARLDTTVEQIHATARAAERDPELHALVQQVIITDDRERVARRLSEQGFASTPADVLSTPFLAIGSPEEIAGHLHACRERWDISYYSVRQADAFAPVIRLIRPSGRASI